MKKKKIKILMLLEGSYPEDIRVRYETKALVEKGYRVSIIALREKGEKLREYIDSISVFRIPRLELFKKGNSSQEYRLSNIVKKITSMVGYIGEYLYVTLGFFFSESVCVPIRRV